MSVVCVNYDAGSGARTICLRTDEYQIHDVTNALKRFLRNLDDPLVTDQLTSQWIQTAGLSIVYF